MCNAVKRKNNSVLVSHDGVSDLGDLFVRFDQPEIDKTDSLTNDAFL